MLCAIDGSAQSIDRAALSMDPSVAQPSIDCPSIDCSHCANDGHPSGSEAGGRANDGVGHGSVDTPCATEN